MTCNTFSAPSSKYSEKALTVEQLESTLLSFQQLNAIQNDPAKKYDQEVLLENISLTFERFNELPVDDRTEDFPTLSDRLNQGPITTTEYAAFLDDTQLDITTVNIALQSGPTELSQISYYEQLDQYYDKNFSFNISNGFCSLFTGLLSQLTSLISAGVKLINDLKNFSLDNILEQLNVIKELITKTIDRIVEEALNKIKNFAAKIVNFVNSAAALFTKKIQQLKRFFSEFNIDNLKAKIEEIIANMAGSYEDITPDVIAYILFRLCQLIEIVNDFMQNPLDAFASAIVTYETQKLLLTNVSNNARLGAVNAGLYRPSADEIARTQEQMAGNINGSVQSGLTPKVYVTTTPTPEERALVSNLGEDGNQYVAFASGVLDQNDPYQGAGYLEVRPDVWTGIFRVARRMGKQFTINSGYRSPAYNAALAARSSGVATNSYHMTGLAIDVSMSGVDRNLFIEIASQEGFTGIGTYNSFIHVDRRDGRSTWGDSNLEALALHRADRFRNG